MWWWWVVLKGTLVFRSRPNLKLKFWPKHKLNNYKKSHQPNHFEGNKKFICGSNLFYPQLQNSRLSYWCEMFRSQFTYYVIILGGWWVRAMRCWFSEGGSEFGKSCSSHMCILLKLIFSRIDSWEVWLKDCSSRRIKELSNVRRVGNINKPRSGLHILLFILFW